MENDISIVKKETIFQKGSLVIELVRNKSDGKMIAVAIEGEADLTEKEAIEIRLNLNPSLFLRFRYFSPKMRNIFTAVQSNRSGYRWRVSTNLTKFFATF